MSEHILQGMRLNYGLNVEEYTIFEFNIEPTCPGCGHLVSKHDEDGCNVVLEQKFLSVVYCHCPKTYADLQPKEQTFTNTDYPRPEKEKHLVDCPLELGQKCPGTGLTLVKWVKK